MSEPRDCPHGVQYRKRMHLCAACMEPAIDAALGFTRRVRGAVEVLGNEVRACGLVSQRVLIAVDLLTSVVFDRDDVDHIEQERDHLRELVAEVTAERDALQAERSGMQAELAGTIESYGRTMRERDALQARIDAATSVGGEEEFMRAAILAALEPTT